MSVPVFGVDAFSAAPFGGNPAAVCVLRQPAAPEWMQAVAAEFNLSETSFLLAVAEGWQIRWFTPAVEVALCGHATLASAHILWETGQVRADESIVFSTQYSGRLTCRQSLGRITMDFPVRRSKPAAPPEGLLPALGAPAVGVERSVDDWLVEVPDAATVRQLRPDFARLRETPARGVIVTAPAEALGPYDFISRFFAPAVGINEDPVTGSAHCTLAAYWGARLSKVRLRAYQASRRGGEVEMELRDERVLLGGSATTVWRGQWA